MGRADRARRERPSRRLGFLRRLAARAGLAVAGLLLAVATLGGAAEDAHADVLVSNTTASTNTGSNNFGAQSFETGDNAAGYTISDIQIRVSGANSTATTVIRIREDDSGGPGANDSDIVVTLSNPASLTVNALNTFTVPAGDTAELKANTTYWVTVNEGVTNNRVHFAITATDTETGLSGWSIGNGTLWRSSEGSNWITSQSSFLLAINGAAKTSTTPATITAIAFTNEPTDGEYNPGDVAEVLVTFSKPVEITGTPRVEIRPYENWVRIPTYAEYVAAASTSTVAVFRHTITGPREGNNQISLPPDGMELNGATIRNPGTTVDANLSHGHTVSEFPINTRLLDTIEATSTPRVPASDTGGIPVFGPGDDIEITVRFKDTIRGTRLRPAVAAGPRPADPLHGDGADGGRGPHLPPRHPLDRRLGPDPHSRRPTPSPRRRPAGQPGPAIAGGVEVLRCRLGPFWHAGPRPDPKQRLLPVTPPVIPVCGQSFVDKMVSLKGGADAFGSSPLSARFAEQSTIIAGTSQT